MEFVLSWVRARWTTFNHIFQVADVAQLGVDCGQSDVRILSLHQDNHNPEWREDQKDVLENGLVLTNRKTRDSSRVLLGR